MNITQAKNLVVRWEAAGKDTQHPAYMVAYCTANASTAYHGFKEWRDTVYQHFKDDERWMEAEQIFAMYTEVIA